MNRDPDGLSAAEEELLALLELLRAEGLEPGAAVTDAVLRTVQWQVLVRGTIVLIGDLVGSMAAALALFISNPPRTREDGE
jgi:hypothetical protein